MRFLPRFGLAACAVATLACAVNRAQVKSLSDPTATAIQFEPVIDTTIAALNAIPSRCGPANNRRARTEEFHVYRVVGTVGRVRRKRDHDIHIVLADPTRPDQRLIVESDDPGFRLNFASPYHGKLADARQMLDALMTQAGVSQLDDLSGMTVRVAGVGFFDISHFQKGRSRSCIELHPVLTIVRWR